MSVITLETSNLILEFNKKSGSLEKIYSKLSDWDILGRRHLGLSWRLMLPLENRRNNNAWGHEQEEEPEFIASDSSVSFIWKNIRSEFGGKHNITVESTCSLKNDQVVFEMEIYNNSNIVVENVYYPYFGDVHRPKNCRCFKFMHPEYTGMKTYEMYPTFPNTEGTHSVLYPTKALEGYMNPPMCPFALMEDEQGNGLYIGLAERRHEVVTWHAELHPGWEDSNGFKAFKTDTALGKDVFIRFATGHLPFIKPKERFTLLPFSIEAYKGNWNTGLNCYTKVSKAWNRNPVRNLPEWAKTPHSWLQIQINSSEDELRLKFKDLPKVAAECRQYGVTAIQLVGWNDGGQDRGNPSHSPDPRLGTFEELKQTIKEIRDMGVKIILFAKFNWADQSNPDFDEVFEPLAVKDPYGHYYHFNGYKYMTLSQLTNVSTRRLIPMCFGSESYREICNREFQKCVDLGADGILYDECLNHHPTLCCFDTSHGHKYGESSYKWDETLIDGFRKILDGREFMIAGEAVYDFQHDYYDISYTRTWGINHKPTSRLMRPDAGIMTAVVGFNDRGLINQCLLNRYIISYEPYNFKGLLSDYPETVKYGGRMDKLRKDLHEYFWDGEFLDKQCGNAVCDNGELFTHYAVYKGTNGKYGMVLCNYDSEKEIRVRPVLDSGQELSRCRSVDEDELSIFDDYITIKPSSAVAVI